MLWAAHGSALELRTEGGATRLRASFPYGAEAELAPGRREVIASRAFGARIEAGEDIHLLAGHDYEKPLASRAAGNLTVTDTDAALVIEATIDGGTTWARDFLAAHAAGLIRAFRRAFALLLVASGSKAGAIPFCALSQRLPCSRCLPSPGPPMTGHRSRREAGSRWQNLPPAWSIT